MKQDHQTSFGRQISAVAMISDTGMADKWHLLAALTEAADAYGLCHRSLGVLRALLSFHRDRMIGAAPLSAIVFPANATLSQRLGGMPESTLRRHLATLLRAGIVSRHDSANRKRYARGAAGPAQLAFGFDLSPLARHADAIDTAAAQARAHRAQLQQLRCELAALRQQALDLSGPDDLTEEAFKILRRKPDAAQLSQAIDALRNHLETEKPSACGVQNERHIQQDSKIYSEEPRHVSKTQTPGFEAVVTQCSEYLSFFPEHVHDWQGLSRVAHAVAPMMGIEQSLYADAIMRMGHIKAITAVLCILESLGRIKNPGGYLRRLIERDGAGQVDFVRLLDQSTGVKGAVLSADNL